MHTRVTVWTDTQGHTVKRVRLTKSSCAQSFTLTLKVLVTTIDALGHLKQDNFSTVGGDEECRIGEVRAGTTSPMLHHKGFEL